MHTTTTTTALAALGTPWWYPYLQSVSDIAATVLPILGVVWLCVQIIHKMAKTTSKKDD